ncbi:ABC transporter permease subunit [Kribbella sp. NBC_01245]|uniref:ABC transporter permease subunit n=1 Tax=Kribbella sp. NBC_01245 TaxID=2903578 RepID=UPI002E2A8757|nr:ABC transporter permease subunit [Kribbella sp. NBC_01245]
MIRLTRAEIRRLLSRRLSLVGALGALAITAGILLSVYQEAKPLPADAQATMRADFERAHQDWESNRKQLTTDCLAAQAQHRATDPNADFHCNDLEPRLEHWGKPETRFTELAPEILLGSGYMLGLLAFLIGASFIGAEFSTGSIATWLTFEPRRLRVYISKLAAAALVVAPLAVLVVSLLTGGIWLIVDRHGSTTGVTADAWSDLSGTAGRIVLLTCASAIVGTAVGLMVRHTAAALGIVIAYLALIEGTFSGVLQQQQLWLVGPNIRSWIHHGTTYPALECSPVADGNYQCSNVDRLLTFTDSSLYLGLTFALVVALAALVFHRRDIT